MPIVSVYLLRDVADLTKPFKAQVISNSFQDLYQHAMQYLLSNSGRSQLGDGL
jgi:hypothetical protein